MITLCPYCEVEAGRLFETSEVTFETCQKHVQEPPSMARFYDCITWFQKSVENLTKKPEFWKK